MQEPRRLGRLLGLDWLVGWTYWSEIIAVSFSYDASEVERLVKEFDETGYVVITPVNQALLWCDAAEALARCERFESARAALERAVSTDGMYEWYLAYTEASIEARGGDPMQALSLLDATAAMDGIDVDHSWRLALLRGYALHRAGDAEGAAAGLAESVAIARELGQPSLPDIVEGQLVAKIQSGSSAADDMPAIVEVALFDKFELRHNGAVRSVPSGRVSDLLKLLIVNNGHLVLDQVVDALWPDATLQQGRKRLRNVINRLHDAAGTELVSREGSSLHLVTGVASDFARAVELAQSAVKPGMPLGALSAALQACDRELLPESRYADWAEAARLDHLHRVIGLLDAQAAAAEAEGDIDGTVGALRRAHAIDQWNTDRLTAAADLLRNAGREAAAAALVSS